MLLPCCIRLSFNSTSSCSAMLLKLARAPPAPEIPFDYGKGIKTQQSDGRRQTYSPLTAAH
jgi:hypothetical protein